MSLSIGTNDSAIRASQAASIAARGMETSMERLSTGKRINSATDDAAGVAIASRLSAEIRGANQSIRNALDGQALINTAEGGHKEIENILQRMREISVQAANDTNNAQDRTNLQAEMDAMIEEIDRIAETTTWAGTNLMKDDNSVFEFQVGTAVGSANQIKVTIAGMTASDLDLSGTSGISKADFSISQQLDDATAPVASDTLVLTPADADTTDGVTEINIQHAAASDSGAVAKLTFDGVTVTLSGDAQADVTALNSAFGNFGISAGVATDYNTADNAAHGDTPEVDYITLTVPEASTGTQLSVSSDDNARTSIGKIDDAIEDVNVQRSQLGAISNRLNHTVNNLTNISSNLSAAKGGIEDADFALETTNLAKNQILQQASTAMLAQANASQGNVLALLRS
ncbi:MAG TPA: flagellin [Rhodobacteraceae bacterium]|nr:flagellin [Paracoccaceae bacterium]